MFKVEAAVVSLWLMLCFSVGCSYDNSPIEPNQNTSEIPISSQVACTVTTAPVHHMLGAFSLRFDASMKTVTAVPDREAMVHYNVTPFLFPPHCNDCISIEILEFSPVHHKMRLDVKLKNPFDVSGYDVRGILMTNQPGWDIDDAHGYNSLFDDGGEIVINPFMVFTHSSQNDPFGPGDSKSKTFDVIFPDNPDFAGLGYVIDASWPGHCEDVLRLWCEPEWTTIQYAGSNIHLEARLRDWQDDVESITIDLTEVGGGVVEFEELDEDTWTADFFCPGTSGGCAPGEYRMLVTALSDSPIATYAYENIFINPLPSPQDVSPEYLDFGWRHITWNDGVLATSRYHYAVDFFDTGIPEKPLWRSSTIVDPNPCNLDICDITIHGDRSYVSVLGQGPGIRVIDIGNLTTPVIIGTIEGIEPKREANMPIYDHYLYAINSLTNKVFIIDLSTTPLPVVVGKLNVGPYPTSMTIHEDYLYISGTNFIYAADLSDPVNPVITDQVSITYETKYAELTAAGDYLFGLVGDPYDPDRTMISIPLTGPSYFEIADELTIPGKSNDLAIEGDFAYIAGYEDGIRIIDISAPEDLQLVGTVPTEGSSRGVAVGQDVLYVGEWQPNGISSFDITDPGSPHFLNKERAFSRAGKITLADHYALVVDAFSLMGGPFVIQVLDTNIQERTRILKSIPLIGWVGDLDADNEVGCVITYGDSNEYQWLYVLEIGGSEIVEVITILDDIVLKQPEAIAVKDGYAYLAGIHQWMVIDVDPPGDAHVVKTIDWGVDWPNGSLAVAGTRLYLRSQNELRAYDVSIPEEPVFLGNMDFSFFLDPSDFLLARGNYVYMSGILVIDATDPSDMHVCDVAQNDFSEGNMQLMGGFLFTACGSEGVGIFNVFPPGTIEPVFNLPIHDNHYSQYLACRNGYMFISTSQMYTGSMRLYKWW